MISAGSLGPLQFWQQNPAGILFLASIQGDPLTVDLPSTPVRENATHLLAFGASSTGAPRLKMGSSPSLGPLLGPQHSTTPFKTDPKRDPNLENYRRGRHNVAV